MSKTAPKSLHIFAVSHKPNTMQGHNVNNKKGPQAVPAAQV
jgi:hypothetical protein